MKASIWLILLILTASVLVNLPVAGATESTWHSIASPVTADLFDVFMINATEGWIVGDAGTILHWNGVAWTEVTSPTALDLRAVYLLNSTDGWAVGLSGVTIHWNGTKWSQVPSGIVANLLDVTATGFPTYDYYAAGASGTIIKWKGANWVAETVLTSAHMRGVDMYWVPNPHPPPIGEWRGWAVGSGGVILSYSIIGGWSEATSPTGAELNDTHSSWAVGSNWTIVHLEGSNWQNVSSPMTGPGYLTTVRMFNSTFGWAMGYGGAILHWNGTKWTQVISPTTRILNSVFMVDANDGWAVGYDGTIIRWSGTEWVPELSLSTLIPTLIATTIALITLGINRRRNSYLGFAS